MYKNTKKIDTLNAALQQNVSYNVQKVPKGSLTNHKGNNMYDFFKPIELNRTYQQTEKAIKDAYHFWLDVTIDTIKMLKAK